MAAETLFGVHGAALEVRAQRMGVLASNIANASTPGFKARDIDFKAALAAVEGSQDQAGGIGDALNTAISLFHTRDLSWLLLTMVSVVALVDAVGDHLRGRLLKGRHVQSEPSHRHMAATAPATAHTSHAFT